MGLTDILLKVVTFLNNVFTDVTNPRREEAGALLQEVRNSKSTSRRLKLAKNESLKHRKRHTGKRTKKQAVEAKPGKCVVVDTDNEKESIEQQQQQHQRSPHESRHSDSVSIRSHNSGMSDDDDDDDDDKTYQPSQSTRSNSSSSSSTSSTSGSSSSKSTASEDGSRCGSAETDDDDEGIQMDNVSPAVSVMRQIKSSILRSAVHAVFADANEILITPPSVENLSKEQAAASLKLAREQIKSAGSISLIQSFRFGLLIIALQHNESYGNFTDFLDDHAASIGYHHSMCWALKRFAKLCIAYPGLLFASKAQTFMLTNLKTIKSHLAENQKDAAIFRNSTRVTVLTNIITEAEEANAALGQQREQAPPPPLAHDDEPGCSGWKPKQMKQKASQRKREAKHGDNAAAGVSQAQPKRKRQRRLTELQSLARDTTNFPLEKRTLINESQLVCAEVEAEGIAGMVLEDEDDPSRVSDVSSSS